MIFEMFRVYWEWILLYEIFNKYLLQSLLKMSDLWICEIFRVYREWILIQDAARGCYPEPGLFTELGFHWADHHHHDNLFAKIMILRRKTHSFAVWIFIALTFVFFFKIYMQGAVLSNPSVNNTQFTFDKLSQIKFIGWWLW